MLALIACGCPAPVEPATAPSGGEAAAAPASSAEVPADPAPAAPAGQLLSVVGDVVSYEIDEGGDCGGAHPFATHGYFARRLGPDVAAPLSELFDADAAGLLMEDFASR